MQKKTIDYFIPKILENPESRKKIVEWFPECQDSAHLLDKLSLWSSDSKLTDEERDTLHDVISNMAGNCDNVVDDFDVHWGDFGPISIHILKCECIYFAQGVEGEEIGYFTSQREARTAAEEQWC